MGPLTTYLDERQALCQSCYTRAATTSIRLIDGPLRVCSDCEAEWVQCAEGQ